VTGEGSGVTRVVDQLVNEILIEGELALNYAQENSLVQPEDVERKGAQNTDQDLRTHSRKGNGDCAGHDAPLLVELMI
jgi:hypothetical protein